MSTPETAILAKLQAITSRNGPQAASSEDQAILDKLAAIAGPGPNKPAAVGEIPEPNLGVTRAFGAGIKEGILKPLTIFGYEGEDVPIDQLSERVSNYLGQMVGLGIGFIPFSFGTGVALRGIGLTRSLTELVVVEGKTVRKLTSEGEFVRNILAGTTQATGTAKTPEEIPKQAAIGAAIGVGVDGFFLARAIRGRGLAKAVEGELANPEILAKEIELAPKASGKTEARMATEVAGLADEAKTYDDVLRDLAHEHVETVRVPYLGDPTEFVRATKEALPNAQVLTRKVIGQDVSEVLIHNPVDESARLSPKQIRQFETTGAFEGMGVSYRGNMYEATGVPVKAGMLQVRSLDGRVTFAADKSDITDFLTPIVFSPESRRAEIMRNAVLNTDEVGFTVAARGARGAEAVRRGTVDTSDFKTVESLQKFMEENRSEILKIEAPSIEEAARQYALSRGIKGLKEVDNGITRRIHVFDQQTINYVHEPPRVNVLVDNSVIETTEQGRTILHSFVPGWENSVVGPLRRQGYAEKEIRTFLEKYTAEESRRLEKAMSGELQAIAERSRFQFYGGCE